MENAPEAAAPATEATNTNTNPAPEAPAEAPAQPNMHGFTEDQLAEMAKFMEANGGYDKSWKTYKDRISNPAPAQEPQTAEPVQQQQQQPAQEQPTRQAVPNGFMTQQEFMAQQYYNALANDPKYESISDKIRSGEMFKEMGKFGIIPMDKDGNINDVQVREFFDLYAKTIPATPAPSPEASNAPTVDYIAVNDGKIESMDQAARIIAQSSNLTSRGLAAHPNLEAAETFMKEYLSGKKK